MLLFNMMKKKIESKSKVFSVSFRESEVGEMNGFLDKMKKETGFKISRNEFVRRAVLAQVRYFSKKGTIEYKKIFSSVE